jgi:hypothetical protein
MPYEILAIDGDRIEVLITGELRRQDQDALQAYAKPWLDAGRPVRLLVLLQDFRGWEQGADWGDIGFLVEHGNDIERIAVVGDERWRDDVYAFLGKGLRKTVIAYFPATALAEARAWLQP